MSIESNELETAKANSPQQQRARRAVSPKAITLQEQAAAFAGLPKGVKHPDRLLETFKAAAPALKIPKAVVELVCHLAGRAQAADWNKGTRPLVWPSNQELMHSLGRKPTAISSAISAAVKLGFVVMKDSPSGKRYGGRDEKGRIIEARTFGFDLSPLALRHAEFVAAAEQHRNDHRARMTARRQVTIEREALLQIIDTAEQLGVWSNYWEQAHKSADDTRAMLTPTLGLAETQHLAQCLAKWRAEAKAMLDQAMQNPVPAGLEGHGTEVESESELSENRKLKNTTNPIPKSINADVVTARQEGSSGQGTAEPPAAAPGAGESRAQAAQPTVQELDRLDAKGITPARVAEFCPMLGQYAGLDPSWPELAAAAQRLAGQYGISHRTWARGYLQLGPAMLTLAFAILASLPHDHFKKGPGAYFAGMLKAHREGKLNLIGSFHGMRVRAGEGACPTTPPQRAAVQSYTDRRQLGAHLGRMLERIRPEV